MNLGSELDNYFEQVSIVVPQSKLHTSAALEEGSRCCVGVGADQEKEVLDFEGEEKADAKHILTI